MKKLNLKNLHVQSFVTSLDGKSGKTEQYEGGATPGIIGQVQTLYCLTNDCVPNTDLLLCQPLTRNGNYCPTNGCM